MRFSYHSLPCSRATRPGPPWLTGWLAEGLPGQAAKTVEVYRDALRPVLAVAGRISLRDLTVQDVRTALAKMAVTHSTATLQKAHNS